MSESSEPRGGLRLEVARTLEELERLRAGLGPLPWEREEAAYEYFVTRLRTRPDVIGPFAAVVCERRTPGRRRWRRESRRGGLQTAIGYRVVYAPRVRLLQVVDGGIVSTTARRSSRSAVAVERRARGAARSTWSRSRRSSSVAELFGVFATLGGPLWRAAVHRAVDAPALVLPATFEEFVASLGQLEHALGVHRDARQLASRVRRTR